MLEVKNVTKRYGKIIANKNLNFSIEDGSIGILMGPNGAGKSTIIKSIVGLLRYEGEITINGYSNKSIEAKKILGYVPEFPAMYDLLTVGEHIEFISRLYENYDKEYSDSLLERFDLIEKKDDLAKSLSKGMQQKLSIVTALAHKPKFILFDEPIVGLDPHAIKQIKLLFRELKAEGDTLLISTHILDSVEDYWDEVNILVKGEFAASRTKTELEEKGENLEDLFFSVTEGKNNE